MASQQLEEYERRLRTAGFIDFDDMVLLGLRLIETHPWVRKVLTARFPVLVVDEYQDLGLTNGITYYYQVSALTAAGEGPRSSQVAATPRTQPSAARNLVATRSARVGEMPKFELIWSPFSTYASAAGKRVTVCIGPTKNRA